MNVRFAPDFADVSASLKVFDRGDYEVKTTAVDPFAYIKSDEKKGEYVVCGASLKLEMVGKLGHDGSIISSDDEGESVVPLRLYMHSRKGWGFTKGIIMSLMGYVADREEEFNAIVGDLDFGLTPQGEEPDDEGAWSVVEAGAAWQQLVGVRNHVTLSKRIYEEREQQEMKNWRPVPTS